MKGMLEASRRFFDLTAEEKREFEGTEVLSPIRCGTSFNATADQVLFWRDFLKLFVHPEFHSPTNPPGFRYVPFPPTLMRIISNSRTSSGEINLFFSPII